MQKKSFPKMPLVVGALAFGILGYQIATDVPGGVVDNGLNGGVAQAGAITTPVAQITPWAPPANLTHGVPGGPGNSPEKGWPANLPATDRAFVPAADSDVFRTPAVGIPMIVPTLPNTDPSQPTFTVNDVMRVANTRRADGTGTGIYGAAGFMSSVPTNVVKVEFMTLSALQARGYSTDVLDLPDTTLLCYVQCGGAFRLNTPPGMQARKAPYAFELYNARTGNLLQWGTEPALK